MNPARTPSKKKDIKLIEFNPETLSDTESQYISEMIGTEKICLRVAVEIWAQAVPLVFPPLESSFGFIQSTVNPDPEGLVKTVQRSVKCEKSPNRRHNHLEFRMTHWRMPWWDSPSTKHTGWLFVLKGVSEGWLVFVFVFSRQGFSVDQAGLKLSEIRLPLPPEYWD